MVSITLQECCKSCATEFASIKNTIAGLNGEVAMIEQKIRKLKRSQPAMTETQLSQGTELEDECQDLTSNSTTLFNSVSVLLQRPFTVDKISSNSVSGKASNSKTKPNSTLSS